MRPAYHIPLADNDLKRIGEICAIQGQIEYLMQNIVGRLLKLGSTDARLAVMGGTGIKANANVFIQVARNKLKDADLLKIAEGAFRDIAKLTEGRNDFVHAFYAHGDEDRDGGFTLTGGDTSEPFMDNIVAIRTGNRKRRKVEDIQIVRNEAARVSLALAHIDFALMTDRPEHSPWLCKF